MRKFSIKNNARIVFRQVSKNSSYLLHLYDLFKPFVTTPPTTYNVLDKKKLENLNTV